MRRPVDLVAAVLSSDEYGLDRYAEAVALIVAADLAQVELLEEFHGVRFREAKLAYGYSLGELSAVACGGVLTMAEVLSVPVAMADRLRRRWPRMRRWAFCFPAARRSTKWT